MLNYVKNGKQLKIGMVGSRRFLDRRVIHEFITEFISLHGTEINIIGADFIAKSCALRLGVKYTEHPPFRIALNCDILIAFIPKGHKSNGAMSTVRSARKHNKSILITDGEYFINYNSFEYHVKHHKWCRCILCGGDNEKSGSPSARPTESVKPTTLLRESKKEKPFGFKYVMPFTLLRYYS